jgi:hypothetical protein
VNIPSFFGQLVSLIGSSGIVECLLNNHIRSFQGPVLDSSQSERSQNPLCSWPAVSKNFSSFPFNLHPMRLDHISCCQDSGWSLNSVGAIRQDLSKLPPAFMLPTISIRFCWTTHHLSVLSKSTTNLSGCPQLQAAHDSIERNSGCSLLGTFGKDLRFPISFLLIVFV